MRVAVERGLDRVKSSRGLPEAGARGQSRVAGEAFAAALTYKSREPLPVGRRVEVPLGRRDKASAGIIVQAGGRELLEGLSAARVKPILRDTGAGLPAHLVQLAVWMATYYVCPLGMVLAVMLPAAVKQQAGVKTRTLLSPVPPEQAEPILREVGPRGRKLWQDLLALEPGRFPILSRPLADALRLRTVGPIARLVKLGLLTTTERDEVVEHGHHDRDAPHIPASSVQATIEQFLESSNAAARPTLTDDQTRIVAGIGARLNAFSAHLIRGVTGSGKTEVYLQIIEKTLGEGRNALVLVPEISLTPQTAARFTERFRSLGIGRIAVLHSGLTASQRHKQWQLASKLSADGGARVVVGARSAVFAPIENVGVIVVDEEHASDYKQDQLPRYHGRDVAIKRGQIEGCPVILGSATPSLESWANAGEGGAAPAGSPAPKYTLWELPERVGGARMPTVQVVDLRQERRESHRQPGSRGGRDELIGPTLEAALHKTLAAGGQAILLLNRRGYATYITCSDTRCEYVLSCDDCDALMIHHRVLGGGTHGWVMPSRAVVRCHHCLASKLLPSECPLCNKPLVRLGMGTQKLEEELTQKFPELATEPPGLPKFARVDGDTTRSAREWFDTLQKFASCELRLLVGTQMIAKGLDFPNVRLVGVVNADTGLSLPDFRASERTFQLIAQVAGRAGRGAHAGHVVVQSFEPNVPAIRHAVKHDYVGFAAQEMLSRRRAGLPPAARMARIVIRDLQLADAEAEAKALAEEIRSQAAARGWGEWVRVLGPMPAPISRIARFHRFAVEIVTPIKGGRGMLQEVLAAARAKGLVKSDAKTAIDVDPISLL